MNTSIQHSTVDTEDQLLQACRARSTDWEKALVMWLQSNGAWLERRCIARLGSRADA